MPHVPPHHPHDPDQPRRCAGVWSASTAEALVDDAHRPPGGVQDATPQPATTRGVWGSREQRSAALVDTPRE